jgi:low density lipoprotein receptor-related protein 5/6
MELPFFLQVAVRGLNEPRAILVDWVGHNIIWSDVDLRMREARNHEDLGRLCMMTYDATFTRIIAWKGLDVTWALAYDPATGFLYWSDVFNQSIQRIRLDGKDRSVVVLGCSADGLTIDFEENQLYWTDKLSNSIKLSNMDGSNQRTLIQNPSQLVYPYAVVTLGFYVYWTDLYKRAVLVAVKSTSQEKKIVEGQLLNPHDIGAFHIGRQPNFTSLCSTEESGCSHFCLSIPPGFVCACPTGVKLLSDGKTCAPGLEKFILFARGYDIRILSLDVPLSDTIDTKTLFPVHYVLAVAYDVVEDYIYWPDEDSNTGANVILRGRANSSTTEVVVKDMTALFNGLAVDWISRNLYFVDSNVARIKVSRLDGSYEKTLIYTDLDIPHGIVVDPVEGYMYFSDVGKKAKIEKACMDGSNRSVLIQSNMQSPNVLALDFEARKLYWSDGAAHAIEFCDLWGEHRAHLLHLQQSGYPYGLAISGSVLFWTDHMLKTLNRGQKENAENHKILLDHVPTVYEMLLIDKTKRIGSNYCKKDNGGCSHLCLPRPEGRTCECPDWFQFKDAQKTQCSAPIPTLVYTHHTQQYGFLRAITLTANPTATTLDIPDKEVLSPVALANDVIEQKVYWSDLERNQIRRASLEKSTNTNGDMEVIIQFGAANLGGLAVDWMARNLYWTVIGRDQIDMARLDGSLRTPFKWVDVKKPVPLAVEPEEGLLYWASWSDPPHIQSARLSNSSDSQVLMTLSKPFQPNSMTIDHASRCLFWADANSRTISMINLRYKPLTRVTLLSGTSKIGLKPSGIAIFNNTLYWANFAQQQLEYIKVKKKPMSMKNAKTLAGIASINDKVDMTIVDYKRQSSINQCKFKNGGCSHYCLSAEYQWFQCGCPVYLELARRTKNSPWEICNVPKALMMYSSKTDMYLVNLTNPNAMQNQTDAPIHLDIATDITHIEVDIEHSRIFWTNSKNWLYCSTFDGKESRLLVHRVTVFDMAVHHVTGQLFFTSEDSNAIEALWPDGRSVGVVMASQQLHPRSLALDSDAGNLYWTDWGENPSIRSASLDGSHHKLLIDSNLVAPTGLLVDESRGEMYWLDWKREVLEKSDLLGANRRSMLLEFKEPGSLAAGGHYLFYSVPSTGSILQLNKTIGGHLPVSSHAIPPEVMRSGLTNVTDVYVYESRLFPSNPCANDNGNCSHLCIPTGDGDHLCSCPMNSKLTDDHRTCSSKTKEGDKGEKGCVCVFKCHKVPC